MSIALENINLEIGKSLERIPFSDSKNPSCFYCNKETKKPYISFCGLAYCNKDHFNAYVHDRENDKCT